MPAMLDDPQTPLAARRSGTQPYPVAGDALPAGIQAREVTLRDGATRATVLAFSSPTQVPAGLAACLSAQFNDEIARGLTYPMLDGMPAPAFAAYWFGLFGAVMLRGDVGAATALVASGLQAGSAADAAAVAEATAGSSAADRVDWARVTLGSFYVKPNYPGRSSHVCNAGFLVTHAARGLGVGRLLGETYLVWAPLLGYRYSVFNLVYENNVASTRIWDALGFDRIGRVPGCGNLAGCKDGEYVDAIIFGKDLTKS